MPNLLVEFEKRYKGDPSQTMEICGKIAKEFNLDTDEVANYVYLNRYTQFDEELEELEKLDDETLDTD